MVGLIGLQATSGEALREDNGLAECEAEPFTSDRIHAAGGIADKSGSAPINAPQSSRCRDRAPLCRCPLQTLEATSNDRKSGERPLKAQTGVSGYGNDADFVGRNRGDIQLAVISPIQAPYNSSKG